MQASQRDSHNAMVCVCESRCNPKKVLGCRSWTPKKLLGCGVWTPYTIFGLVCTIYSKVHYFDSNCFPIFNNLSEPGLISAQFSRTDSRVRYPLDIKKVSVRIECVCVTIHHPRNEKLHSGRLVDSRNILKVLGINTRV